MNILLYIHFTSTKFFEKHIGSSHCGSVVTNPTSSHENLEFDPWPHSGGSVVAVDPLLLWCRPAATASVQHTHTHTNPKNINPLKYLKAQKLNFIFRCTEFKDKRNLDSAFIPFGYLSYIKSLNVILYNFVFFGYGF